MSKPVVSLADLKVFPMQPEGGSETFGASIASFAAQEGMTALGAMFISVEPGKRAFPFHNHLAKDEMFVILEGEGTYRFGEDEHSVRAGDVCLAPKGGPDTAHQLINTGTDMLKYLGISSAQDPDIVEYPDSGKFAAIGISPGDSFFTAHVSFVGRKESATDYWDGEDT